MKEVVVGWWWIGEVGCGVGIWKCGIGEVMGAAGKVDGVSGGCGGGGLERVGGLVVGDGGVCVVGCEGLGR